jgi:TatD DNase family protein
MNLVDTHAHLFLPEFESDIRTVVINAAAAGVFKFYVPNIDPTTVERLHNLCDLYPGKCLPMMGLHPTRVNKNFREDLAGMKKLFDRRKYIAVGEIGIDLYHDHTFLKEQKEAFEEQLRWSVEHQLPVSIHAREAFTEVFDVIYKIGANNLRGVFHSFTGTRGDMEEITMLRNFMIGVNGMITYRKVAFVDYLNLFPIERILLETDAPYLPPLPHRGKRNEPAYMPLIAEKLAKVYGISVGEVVRKTTGNAIRLFGE